jgi:beta-lactamase regulating signal transducer with metallopeptidase domain
MTLLISWISASTLRLLALSLLHFLWQGAALAALAYVLMAFCRSAAARYAIGVSTLALMMAAPIGTFLVFRSQEKIASPTITAQALVSSESATVTVDAVAAAKNTLSHRDSEGAPPYFPWLVELWFAGVLLLSLRSAGGILLVERLRRRETMPVTEELLEVCMDLQRRMELTRAVRYCESLHLDAPAVAGWIKPVVLLPVSALSGLTSAQLEAVIAHELAHIGRYDAFVNLFQVGVETLLFYHPAVWWTGKRVRVEREHCCDDTAVELCGSPVTYAHALTAMAESKSAPQLAMAANRSPLVERIARLLGANRTTESFSGANLSAGVLCLSAALLAGSALVGSVHRVQAQTPAPAPVVPVAAVEPAAPAHAPRPVGVSAVSVTIKSEVTVPASPAVASRPVIAVAPVAVPAPVVAVMARPSSAAVPKAAWSFAYRNSVTFGMESSAPVAQSSQGGSETAKQSYIDSLNAAGLTNLSVDELIALKVQGVTGDYVKSVKEQNIKVDVDTLVGLKVQGITAEYIKGMREATGQNLDADELIGLKVQGVTPEYIKQMHDLGLKTDADDVIGMKVQGVTPEYVREMRGLGLKADSDEIIGMKVQGITSEYVKGFNEMGLHPNTDELIGMNVQGVTAAYLKELQAAGFKVEIDDAIGAKIQGVTPEFIAKVRSHGFKDLTLDKLIALKQSGVFDAEK